MRFLFFLITILLTSSFAITQDTISGFSFDHRKRSVRIPVRMSHNLIIIPMRINDSPPLNFILDTGVNTTILTEPLVAQVLGLELDRTAYVLGLGSDGVVEAGISSGLTFSLKDITGKNMNLIVLPEGVLSFSEIFGFPVHGIIGHDFFREFAIRVNYRTHAIRVFRRANYRIPRKADIIPLSIRNNKPYITISLQGRQEAKIDSLELLVDLGASFPIYLNHDYRHLSEETIPSYLGKGISGELKGNMGRVKKIQIGEFGLNDPTVAYPQQDFLQFAERGFTWEGILGGGILKRFHMIIDYPSEKLVVWRNRNFRKPFTTNLSGIEIIAKGANYDEYIINYIRPNSIADQQDIRIGDQLVAIDNKNVEKLGVDKVFGILNRDEGTKLWLRIKRDSLYHNKMIILREDLP